MKRKPVSSTSIRSVGYDRKQLVLEVLFHNTGLYDYFNVPADVYADLLEAESKGAFFNTVIKDNYSFVRLR